MATTIFNNNITSSQNSPTKQKSMLQQIFEAVEQETKDIVSSQRKLYPTSSSTTPNTSTANSVTNSIASLQSDDDTSE